MLEFATHTNARSPPTAPPRTPSAFQQTPHVPPIVPKEYSYQKALEGVIQDGVGLGYPGGRGDGEALC